MLGSLALLGGALVVVLLGEWVPVPSLVKPAGTLFLIMVPIALAAQILVATGRCPECKRLFHTAGFPPAIFSKRCVHCGLELRS